MAKVLLIALIVVMKIISVIPLVTLPTSIMLWRSCDTFMYNYIRLWGADIANISISLNIYAA